MNFDRDKINKVAFGNGQEHEEPYEMPNEANHKIKQKVLERMQERKNYEQESKGTANGDFDDEMSGLNELREETAIEYCERVHPETCKEFKKIQQEMYETFCRKQRNYGPQNISVGVLPLEDEEDINVSLTGIWFRMNDKIQRLKQLVVKGQPDEVGESIQDTYEDLSVYGIIAQIVKRKVWGQ